MVGVVSKFDYLSGFVFTPAHMMPRYDDLMDRTVADIMTMDFIYVGTDTRLTRVLQLMVDHRLRSMPVIDNDQRLAGIISREDVMRRLATLRSAGRRRPAEADGRVVSRGRRRHMTEIVQLSGLGVRSRRRPPCRQPACRL